MGKLTNIRINYERWLYRIRQARKRRTDAAKMAIAIADATKQSKKIQKRLWVIKLDTADYAIMTKPQLRVFLRRLGIIDKINYFQPNHIIMHITGKPE